MSSTKRIAIGLFCGCGGMDLGAELAGFDSVFSADTDPLAVETYNTNLTSRAHVRDLSQPFAHLLPKDVDLLLGGPPCQGFSSAGSKDADDPRNRLWRAYLEAVAKARPKVFVMENVTGFGSELPSFFEAVRVETANSYVIRERDVVTQFYGVPQFRHRKIVLGVRRDVLRGWPWPTPIAKEHHDFTRLSPGLISMETALADLGPPDEYERTGTSDGRDHISVPLVGNDDGIAWHIPNGALLRTFLTASCRLPTSVGRGRAQRVGSGTIASRVLISRGGRYLPRFARSTPPFSSLMSGSKAPPGHGDGSRFQGRSSRTRTATTHRPCRLVD